MTHASDSPDKWVTTLFPLSERIAQNPSQHEIQIVIASFVHLLICSFIYSCNKYLFSASSEFHCETRYSQPLSSESVHILEKTDIDASNYSKMKCGMRDETLFSLPGLKFRHS